MPVSCDGDALAGESCTSLDLPDGELACRDDCQFDTSDCAVCDDGICSDAETAASCPRDCGVKSVAAGTTHTCAALANGSIWCWGARQGHGMGGTPDTNTPVRVPGFDNVVQVTAGDRHTCFATADSEVFCFGASGFGEAGALQGYPVFPPEKVADATRVVAGAHHTCGLRASDDNILCWGRGDYGQRGDGVFSMRQAQPGPLDSTISIAVTDIAMGDHFGCETFTTSSWCWGDNRRGQLAIGGFDWQADPERVLPFTPSLQITGVAAGSSHLCLNVNPESDPSEQFLYCIGSNAYGQLAKEPSPDSAIDAGVIEGRMELVDGGFAFTCGENVSDPNRPQLQCWGDNYFGQLGNGSDQISADPVAVDGIGDIIGLSVGHDHACAILPDATVRCWGRNREGQLGNRSDARSHDEPVVPVGLGPSQEVN